MTKNPSRESEKGFCDCRSALLRIQAVVVAERLQSAGEAAANRLELPVLSVAVKLADDNRSFNGKVLAEVIAQHFLLGELSTTRTNALETCPKF